MRPLDPDETLLLPEDERHACTVCGVDALGFDDLDRAFGFRRMGDGVVRIQSRCHKCRKLDADECEVARDQHAEFVTGRHGKPGVVYAICIAARELTKIGFTAAHPADRMRSLQTANPDDLELVDFFPSDYFGERTLHAKLHSLRVRGEWFHLSRADAVALFGAMEVA